MKEEGNLDLKIRTRKFALRIIQLYKALPNSFEAQVIGKQVLRSGTSVGAQYREATRARSTAEFISKNRKFLSGIGRDNVLIRTFG